MKISGKNCAIELTRIVGCLMVIMLHARLPYIFEGKESLSNLIVYSLVRDGVTLFWLIQGYFIISKRGFVETLKRTFFKVLVPALLFGVFCEFFYNAIIYNDVNLACQTGHITNFLSAVFQWNANIVPGCPHLWYVFSYFTVILWSPVINKIVVNKKIRRYVMGVSVISVLLKDIQKFGMLPFGEIIGISIVGESIFFVLMGYELRELLDNEERNRTYIRKGGYSYIY